MKKLVSRETQEDRPIRKHEIPLNQGWYRYEGVSACTRVVRWSVPTKSVSGKSKPR